MHAIRVWLLWQALVLEVAAGFTQPGRRRFVDLHMHMPGTWSLGRAAALRAEVEQALMSDVHGLRASIQLLPSDVEAHFSDADVEEAP